MIYISAPYSHANPHVIISRFNAVLQYFLQLSETDIAISPILVGHQLIKKLPRHEFWMKYSTELLSICTELHVLMLPEWLTSVGVNQEINMANQRNIPVVYLKLFENSFIKIPPEL